MSFKKSVAISLTLAGALLAAGCATQPANQFTPLVTKNITIKRPALQTDTTVEIGQSIMFWAYGPVNTVVQLERPFIFVQEELSLSVVGPSFPAVAMRDDHYIAYVPYVLADGEPKAVEPGEVMLSVGAESCSLLVKSSFSVSTNGVSTPVDNISDIFAGKRAIFGGSQPAREEHRIPSEICDVDQSTISNSEDSFRKELVYLGRSGDTIQLAYREFYNNMARPAFSNSVQYDLAESDVIGFQGARFKVLSATNTLFSYVVMKHLQ